MFLFSVASGSLDFSHFLLKEGGEAKKRHQSLLRHNAKLVTGAHLSWQEKGCSHRAILARTLWYDYLKTKVFKWCSPLWSTALAAIDLSNRLSWETPVCSLLPPAVHWNIISEHLPLLTQLPLFGLLSAPAISRWGIWPKPFSLGVHGLMPTASNATQKEERAALQWGGTERGTCWKKHGSLANFSQMSLGAKKAGDCCWWLNGLFLFCS